MMIPYVVVAETSVPYLTQKLVFINRIYDGIACVCVCGISLSVNRERRSKVSESKFSLFLQGQLLGRVTSKKYIQGDKIQHLKKGLMLN